MQGEFRKPYVTFDPNFIKICVDVYTPIHIEKKKLRENSLEREEGLIFQW